MFLASELGNMIMEELNLDESFGSACYNAACNIVELFHTNDQLNKAFYEEFDVAPMSAVHKALDRIRELESVSDV